MKKILSILSVFFLIACGQQESAKEAAHEDHAGEGQTAAAIVELTRVQVEKTGIAFGGFEQKNLREAVRVNGHLHVPPQNKAEISSYLGAVVRSVHVHEGDFVKQGEVLLELSDPAFLKLQEEYLVAKSNFGFILRDYERQKSLAGDNIASQKAFQEAEARYGAEKARLASLEDQLRLLNVDPSALAASTLRQTFSIIAPISGYVGKINVNTGSFAEPQKELMCVIDNSHLHADLMIYEKDLPRVKPGQTVSITFTNMPDLVMTARIFSVGKEFENESRTVNAHAELIGNVRQDLVPGMYVNGLIETGVAEALAIPEASVVRDKGRDYVFIVDAAMQKHPAEVAFTPVEVKKGISSGGFCEVTPLGRLPEKYQVVVKGAYYVLSQMNLGKGAGCVD